MSDYILVKLDQNRERIETNAANIRQLQSDVDSLKRFKNSFSSFLRRSLFVTIPMTIGALNLAPEETIKIVQTIVAAIIP